MLYNSYLWFVVDNEACKWINKVNRFVVCVADILSILLAFNSFFLPSNYRIVFKLRQSVLLINKTAFP